MTAVLALVALAVLAFAAGEIYRAALRRRAETAARYLALERRLAMHEDELERLRKRVGRLEGEAVAQHTAPRAGLTDERPLDEPLSES